MEHGHPGLRTSRRRVAPTRQLVGRNRLRDHPRLVIFSAGLAAFEAFLVVTFGPASAIPLTPQIVAPAPFGVFHDLRWLLVYHSSWPAFVGELIVLLALRSVIDTFLTRAALPVGVPLPPWPQQLRRVAVFTVVAAVSLGLFATLSFVMAVTSLSWLFFVFVPVLVIVGVILHGGPIDERWWWNAPTRHGLLGVLATFVVLSVAGGVLVMVPSWLVPIVAAIAALAVAWCRCWIVGAVTRRAPHTRRRPVVVIALAILLALVVGSTALGFAIFVAVESGRSETPLAAANATGSPVLVVKGFNSSWNGVTRQWVSGNHRIRRFSYRGLDAEGTPRAYDRVDTHGSVLELAAEMRVQVAALAASTQRPVSIVAESEGALIAQAYLEATPDAPVRTAVLLSPLLEPGRVGYPLQGDSGWGVAGGTVMNAIAAILGTLSPVDVSADTPLFRSIVDEAPLMQSLMQCPVPGVREYAVLPIDSGVASPSPIDVAMPYAVVPAFHGGLLGDHTTAQLVEQVLRGKPAHGSAWWGLVADVVSAGAAAWQAPSLEPELEDRWPDVPGSCAALRAELGGLQDRAGTVALRK